MKPNVMKYLQVVAIVLACVGIDQWTKHVAETRLASYFAGHFAHPVVLTVESEHDGKTVRDVITDEFGDWNSPEEINDILQGVTTDAAVRLSGSANVKTGDVIEVRHREVVIVEDHFDMQYTRNEGAAFSFLADHDTPWRKPFFILTTLIALTVMMLMLRTTRLDQQLMIWSLSLISGGAIGNNLIDRVRLDYVIDFIVWKWTDEYRWPTFNMADVFIVVGVGLMGIEMIAETVRERREAKAAKSAEQADA